MKNRIYIAQWLALKPYEKQAPTDSYYLRIANEVNNILRKSFLPSVREFLEMKDLDSISCVIASYFEDKVSGTNIFNSFINANNELYGKPLPFYDLDGYNPEGINYQDIAFSLWYLIHCFDPDLFHTATPQFIIESAVKVEQLFSNELKSAPPNRVLKSAFSLPEDESDFYKVRDFINKSFFGNYLINYDIKPRFLEIIDDFEEKNPRETNNLYFHELTDSFLFGQASRLLARRAKDWAAGILGKEHPLYADIVDISPKIFGAFLYNAQDKSDVIFEHIASGKEFRVTKKSFEHYRKLKAGELVKMGIIRWQKEWWFSGMFIGLDHDEEYIKEIRDSVIESEAVNFLADEKEFKDVLEVQQKVFLKMNNGRQISFLTTDELEKFLHDFAVAYNKYLYDKGSKSLHENPEFKDESLGKPTGEISDELINSDAIVTVFFAPSSGVEFGLNIQSAFPFDFNPYYSEEDCIDATIGMISSPGISTELCMYCIDNCKDTNAFFQSELGKAFITETDFMLRFWKKQYYYSKPSISYC